MDCCFPALFRIDWADQLTGLYKSIHLPKQSLKQAGNAKPEDIKGFMTMAEVADLFQIELPVLYKELKLEARLSLPAQLVVTSVR